MPRAKTADTLGGTTASGTQIGKGHYTTRPPDFRTLSLPFGGAKQCAVTVGAQLTSSKPGRVKVQIVAG